MNFRKSSKSSIHKSGKRAVRKPFFSEICEVLEPRIVPAVLISRRQVVYTDIDGDTVRVVSNKPVFDPSIIDTVFQFDSGSVDGKKDLPQQLQLINLSALDHQAQGLSLSVQATRGKTGDGLAAIGSVDARSIKLGSVRIGGDLGQIVSSQVHQLYVHSLGRFANGASSNQSPQSLIENSLGSLVVQSNIYTGVNVVSGLAEKGSKADGSIGSIRIGGSLVGGAAEHSGSILASGKIGQVLIKGSILGGAGIGSGSIAAFRINKMVVNGSVAGDTVEGSGAIYSGPDLDTGNGRAGLLFGMDSIVIHGSLIGGAGHNSGGIQSYGKINKIRIDGNLIGGTISKNANQSALFRSGFILGDQIDSILVGGSVISGQNENKAGAGLQLGRYASGAILAYQGITALNIRGELLGNESQHVKIIAGSSDNHSQQETSLGRLNVSRSVKLTDIVAGLALGNNAENADPKIGNINIKGDWISSNIYAGVSPSTLNGIPVARFNNPGVVDSSGIPSQVAQVRIGGQVINQDNLPQSGLYADHVQKVWIGGKLVGLKAGPGNDVQTYVSNGGQGGAGGLASGSGGSGGNGGLLISEKTPIIGRPTLNSLTHLQPLATDPAVYSAISGSYTSVKPSLLASDTSSPWGDALVFPSVNQSDNQNANVPQPTLLLPTQSNGTFNLNQGITFSTWFQARGAGVLLNVPVTEKTTGTYDSPLVYINDTGNLVAGLYDNTPMSIIPNETILSSYLPAVGPATNEPVIGAAYPITTPTQVIDGTWHHVAFTANQTSQSLYLDGLLVGSSVPQYHQVNTGLTPASGQSSINIKLDKQPNSNQVITGSIWQKNVDGQNNDNLTQIATYSFTIMADGTMGPVTTTNTYGNLGLNLNHATVSSISYNPTSTTSSLKITFEDAQITSGTSITAYTNYQSNGSVFSLTPLAAQWSAGTSPSPSPTFNPVNSATQPKVGGTVYPQPKNQAYPTINYPQGFIGAVDEAALWGSPLTQSQIQMAMSGPLSQSNMTALLTEYFSFDNQSWNNVVNTSQSATSQGTVVQPAFIQSSVPTDPFSNLPRLPGYQNWGLKLMTPLASSTVALQPNTPVNYVFSLMANDQLELNLPNSPEGTLSVTVEDSNGNTDSFTMSGGSSQSIAITQTGSFKLSLKWQPNSPSASTSLACTALPGLLNSLPNLTGTFTTQTPTGPVVSYSYSDPTLPTILTPAQVAGNAGPANYFPFWNNAHYFATSTAYYPSSLATAYQSLLKSSVAQGGPSDFCNLIGQSITNPTDLLSYLNNAYQASFGTAAPTPPLGNQPFAVQAESTPQVAIYKFLYNTNLMRTAVYQFYLGGGSTSANFQEWVQQVVNSITQGTLIPDKIATEINSGQTGLDSATVTITTPSSKQTQGKLWLNMSVYVVAGIATGGLSFEEATGFKLLSAAIGIAAPIGQSYLTNVTASGSSSDNYSVDITQISNSTLNYENLSTMATSIDSSMQQVWNSVYNSLNDSFLQKIMSNYGLLQALQTITAKPLGDDSSIADETDAVSQQLTQAAWSQMIPATFTWQPIPLENYPTADELTNVTSTAAGITSTSRVLNLNVWPPISLPTPSSGAYDVATGDFNNDGNQDFVVTNAGSNTFTVGLGDGKGNFPSINTYYIDTYNGKGSTEPEGVEVADFNQDGYLDIVMAIHGINNGALVYWGDGSGTSWGDFTRVNFSDGPQGLAIADFNQDGYPDFAAANNYSSNVIIWLYDPQNKNNFNKSYTIAVEGQPARLAATTYNGQTLLAVAASEYAYVFSISSAVNPTEIFNYKDKAKNTWGIAFGNLDWAGYIHTGSGVPAKQFNQEDGVPDITFTSGMYQYIFKGSQSSSGDLSFSDIWSYYDYQKYDVQGVTAFNLPGNAGTSLGYTDYYGNAIYTFANTGWRDDFSQQGATGINELAVADFNNDGIPELISANNGSGNVSIISLPASGNAQAITTFTQGTSGGSFSSSASSQSLSTAMTPAQQQALIWQISALQGGNAVFVPNGEKSSSGDSFPWQVKIPGAFFTVNAATSGNESGSFLTAWNLYDYNGHPIAQSTAQSLFGNLGRGLQLTPLDPNAPLKNVNGAWFMPAKPLSGAATTWTEAFYNWGQSTPGFGGYPISTNTTGLNGQFYQIKDLPPSITTATGLVSDGTTFNSKGGIDGNGNAYSSNLLGSTINGITLGLPGQPNIIRGYNQTIALPNASNGDQALQLLATGVNGAQTNQNIVINFADGSSQLFVQSFSDWLSPSNFAGESKASTLSYYNNAAGSMIQKQNYVYSYNFRIPQNKIPISVTLPMNTNLIILGMTVS